MTVGKLSQFSYARLEIEVVADPALNRNFFFYIIQQESKNMVLTLELVLAAYKHGREIHSKNLY